MPEVSAGYIAATPGELTTRGAPATLGELTTEPTTLGELATELTTLGELTLAGAPGRGRTGMTLRPTDFRTHLGFRRRAAAFGVWNAP